MLDTFISCISLFLRGRTGFLGATYLGKLQICAEGKLFIFQPEWVRSCFYQHLVWSKDSCPSVDNICEDEEEGVVNCLKKENYEIFVKYL